MHEFVQKMLYLIVIILLLIGFVVLLYGLTLFVKAVILLFKSVYYRNFANENQVDEGFKKYVIKNSDEYKAFENRFDKNIDNLINPKKFEL